MDTSFDQFAGGGWGDQADQDDFNATQSQATKGAEKVPIPATIDALIAMGGDEERYVIGEYSFTTVRVMGRICNVAVSNSSDSSGLITYELCDGMAPDSRTAKRFTVIKYISPDMQYVDKEHKFAEGQMVHAVGKMRLFNNRLSLISFHIREVTTAEMEVFYLDCELARFYYEKNLPEHDLDDGAETGTVFQWEAPPAEPKPGQTQQPHGHGGHGGATQMTPGRMGMATPMVRASGSGTQQQHGSAMRQQQPPPHQQQYQTPEGQNLTVQQKKIMDCIKQQQGFGEEGCYKETIRSKVKPNSANFDEDLHFLLSEGLIYTTIDDEHYHTIDH